MANGVPGFKGIDKSCCKAILAERRRCKSGVRGRYGSCPDSLEMDFNGLEPFLTVIPAQAGIYSSVLARQTPCGKHWH